MLSSIWFFWEEKTKEFGLFLLQKEKEKPQEQKKRKKEEVYKSNIKFLQISLSLMKILVVIDILVIIRFDGYIEKY